MDAQKRPKFRYGSGKWGKALCQVTISSSLSSNRFQAFALPDPEESREPWFEEKDDVCSCFGRYGLHHPQRHDH